MRWIPVLTLSFLLLCLPLSLRAQVTQLYQNPPLPCSPYSTPGVWQLASDGNLYAQSYVFNPTTVTLANFPLPSCNFIQGTDSNFYAWTSGAITKVTLGGTATTLHTFSSSDGSSIVTLLEGSDGNFYGIASGGGAYSDGTIFRITSAGTFTKLYDFTGGPDGKNPSALIQASDGNLYGSANTVIFRASLAGSLAPVGTSTAPFASLLEGTSGDLYGESNNAFYSVSLTGAVTFLGNPSDFGWDVVIGACPFQDGEGNFYCLVNDYVDSYSSEVPQLFDITAEGIYDSGGVDGPNWDEGATNGSFYGSFSYSGNGAFYGGFAGTGNGDCGDTCTQSVNYIYDWRTATIAPMTLALSTSSSLLPGEKTTLTWNTKNAFSDTMARCFAWTSAGVSAGWSGVQPLSGSTSLTMPSTPGSYYYSLTCGGTQSIGLMLNDGVSAITLSASPHIFVAGSTVTLSAEVTGVGPTPTGSVSFYYNDSPIGSAPLNSSGVATLTASSTGVPAGDYGVSARYSGNATYAAATSSLVVVQVLASKYKTAVAFSGTPNPVRIGGLLTLTAGIDLLSGFVSPTGTVVFTSGNVTLGTATVSTNSDSATLSVPVSGVSVGTYIITAIYSGNAAVAGSSASTTITVEAANQPNMTVAATPNPVTPPANVSLAATVQQISGLPEPTGTVFYYVGSTLLGSASLNSSGIAKLNEPTTGILSGTYTVTADYEGDSNYGKASATTSLSAQ